MRFVLFQSEIENEMLISKNRDFQIKNFQIILNFKIITKYKPETNFSELSTIFNDYLTTGIYSNLIFSLEKFPCL